MTEPDPFASAGVNADGYDPDKFYVDATHGILRYRNGSWRDKPYLPHPETGKWVAWARPSGLGKVLDDPVALLNWKCIKVAQGITSRQDLRYRMAECRPLDGEDFAIKLAIANEAADSAGAADGRTRGTTLHTLTERVDRGERVDLAKLPDDLGPTVQAYMDLIQRERLTFTAPDMFTFGGDVHPDAFMRERFVINTETMSAGTLDHIGWKPTWDLPRLLDAKSSKDPEKYGHGFAIQMASYARSGWMLPRAWRFDTGSHADYLTMPATDPRWGAIIWIRDGQAQLLDVKLDDGWHAATTIRVDVLKWRARKDLVTPHDPARDRQPTPAEAVFVTGETSILEALLPAAPIGLPCTECVNGDEDPRPWCDCRSDETCKGPCRNRAHKPAAHQREIYRSGVVELVQAGPSDAPPVPMTVEPLPGRTPIPVNVAVHQGDSITVTMPDGVSTTRVVEDVSATTIHTGPPIISIDDPITDPEQAVTIVEPVGRGAKVDPGRAPVLAERAAATERETVRRRIAAEVRAAKSRADLAGVYERHAADWWDGATELGNQLWPA